MLQQNVQINGFDYDPARDPATVERTSSPRGLLPPRAGSRGPLAAGGARRGRHGAPGLEPVKESLVREVQALQAATDDLMVQVTAKRRKVPTAHADAWHARAAAAAGTPEHPSVAVLPEAALAELPASDSALDLSAAARALDHGLTLLEQLQVVTQPRLPAPRRRAAR